LVNIQAFNMPVKQVVHHGRAHGRGTGRMGPRKEVNLPPPYPHYEEEESELENEEEEEEEEEVPL
ncbi:hypothetical protein Ancab_023807, partial [Ancistrocladus abbreviatus]